MGSKNTIKQLLQVEALKYKKKGLISCIVALILFLLIFKSAEILCRIIWPSHIQNRQWFVMGISFTIHFVCQFLNFLLYLPGYTGAISGYETYRINKGAKRHWEDKQSWPGMKRRLIFYVSLNHLVIYPLVVFLSVKISGIKVRFDEFPTMSEMFVQLLFIMVIEDTTFYWCHRISHEITWLYKYHKVHHEYTETFSLTTEATHPIDYIIGVLIPAALPFVLMGSQVHCFMFFFWQVWKIYISTEGHSGYQFPWSPTRILPFVSDPSYHDYHHKKNIGNYCGPVYLWDFFNGSCDQYFKEYRKNCNTKSTKNN